ncbi:MAG: SCO family protein [Spirochaetota bacterium]|nr:SCO family protein [Spirochaetota bacterium]
MKSKSEKGSKIAVIIMLVLLIAWGIWKISKRWKGGSSVVLTSYWKIPDFNLTERSSKKLSLKDLENNIWVANFFHTNCGNPCRKINLQMSMLQKSYENINNVKLISISLDPERDTPEVLTNFANKYLAPKSRWYFLTGDKNTVYTLVLNGFKLGIMQLQDKNTIPYSSKFVLVDNRGMVRGFFDGENDKSMRMLQISIKTLLGESK